MLNDKMQKEIDRLKPKATKSGKTRSEIGRSSKKKGATGERWFVDKLSEATGCNFMRVPNSGAFVGQSNRDRLMALSRTQGFVALGDIIPPDDLKYRFVFECKNYADLDFHNLINNDFNSKVNGWVEENLYDVESAHMCGQTLLIGLLLIKITRKGTWVVGNWNNISSKEKLVVPSPYINFYHAVSDNLAKQGYSNAFFMCDFDAWLRLNGHLFERVIPETSLFQEHTESQVSSAS
jgi:hypothetical protein